MIAKSNLKKVSLKSVGAVVASGALVAAMAMPAFAESYTGNKDGCRCRRLRFAGRQSDIHGKR